MRILGILATFVALASCEPAFAVAVAPEHAPACESTAMYDAYLDTVRAGGVDVKVKRIEDPAAVAIFIAGAVAKMGTPPFDPKSVVSLEIIHEGSVIEPVFVRAIGAGGCTLGVAKIHPETLLQLLGQGA